VTEHPASVALTVYERFRLTPLAAPEGEIAEFPFPQNP